MLGTHSVFVWGKTDTGRMFWHTQPKLVLVLSVESDQMEMKEHLHNTFVYVTTESALGYKLYFPIHSYCAFFFAFWLWMQNE